jgi:hypothetical protein
VATKRRRQISLGLATKRKRRINQKEEMNITKDGKQELIRRGDEHGYQKLVRRRK